MALAIFGSAGEALFAYSFTNWQGYVIFATGVQDFWQFLPLSAFDALIIIPLEEEVAAAHIEIAVLIENSHRGPALLWYQRSVEQSICAPS